MQLGDTHTQFYTEKCIFSKDYSYIKDQSAVFREAKTLEKCKDLEETKILKWGPIEGYCTQPNMYQIHLMAK